MKLITSPKQMFNFASQLKKRDKKIGFVPTMGCLHAGHLSLIRKARQETDVVVVSIFVNPAQFGRGEDYNKYPRDLTRDKQLARKDGADIIFVPAVADMYPSGYLTYVEVEKLTRGLCGAFRPGHFRGVTTVVTKLFNIVRPDIAYFGQKDAQQAVIIKKMTRDLDMGIKITILPVVRQRDGLAMSSRNVYLSKEQRQQAVTLYRALQEARRLIKAGERNSKKIISHIHRMVIAGIDSVKIDYIAVVNAEGLYPLKVLKGRVLIALAVRLGRTRLIDNSRVFIKK